MSRFPINGRKSFINIFNIHKNYTFKNRYTVRFSLARNENSVINNHKMHVKKTLNNTIYIDDLLKINFFDITFVYFVKYLKYYILKKIMDFWI